MVILFSVALRTPTGVMCVCARRFHRNPATGRRKAVRADDWPASGVLHYRPLGIIKLPIDRSMHWAVLLAPK